MEYSGADWVKSALRAELSPLGVKVADLLGNLYHGIYHMDTKALRKINWKHPEWMEVTVYDHFATVDSDNLTRLVLFAHDYCVRVEIKACNMQYLKICFSERKREEGEGGNKWDSTPTMENHLKELRKHYPAPELLKV